MSVFSDIAFDEHEHVAFHHDRASGLRSIIAIHNTALGPAAGGCRLWRYENEAQAVHDVLRLSQGMSYKNAMADLPLGGGKAVILDDGVKNPERFEAFGAFVESLGGRYITAEDVGVGVEDMEAAARHTRYVCGVTPQSGAAGGDPSPKTALGVFVGIQAAVQHRLRKPDLAGLTVAVQGLGSVGWHLCELLQEAEAQLVVSDIVEDRVQAAVATFSAQAAAPDRVLFEPVDVVAPCALGAILNQDSIDHIQAKVVAGGANNQLATADDGRRLLEAEILYAPDYVINAGGIINVSCEYLGNVKDTEVTEAVMKIGPRLAGIFERSSQTSTPTSDIADALARQRIGRS